MRWFKHLSNAHLDEELDGILHQFGAEGYGVYWRLCEEVAGVMEGKLPRTSLTHSDVKWASIVGTSVRRWRKISRNLADRRLIELQSIADRSSIDCGSITNRSPIDLNSISDRIQITIPKLLKYRDEYSKKSGQKSESVRTVETDRETDRETETQTTNTAKTDAPSGACSVAPPQAITQAPKSKKRTRPEIEKALGMRIIWWREFWALFPCHEGGLPGMDAFERRVRDEETWRAVKAGAERYRARADVDPEMRLKYAQGWLNDERWMDESRPREPPTMLQRKSAAEQRNEIWDRV